jgi:hypothetical protein
VQQFARAFSWQNGTIGPRITQDTAAVIPNRRGCRKGEWVIGDRLDMGKEVGNRPGMVQVSAGQRDLREMGGNWHDPLH